MSMAKYREIYIAESREHLSAIDAELARLAEAPDDAGTLQDLFRHAHSIKGMSATMGFAVVAEHAHGIEDALEQVKQRSAPFDDALRSALARAFDALERMIAAIAEGREPVPAAGSLLPELRRLANGASSAPPPGASGPVATSAPQPPGEERAAALLRVEVRIHPDSPLPSARAAVVLKRLEAHGRIERCTPTREQLVRREFAGRLEALLRTGEPAEVIARELGRLADVDTVEVTIARGGTEQADADAGAAAGEATGLTTAGAPAAPQARAGTGAAPDSWSAAAAAAEPGGANGVGELESGRAPEPQAAATVRIPARSLDRFLDAVGELIVQRSRLSALPSIAGDRSAILELDRLKGLVDRLYGEVMTLRMLPFETIAHRFTRSARELSDLVGKRVSLKITGGEILLDRSMLDELSDPINHALRNAIDHGIEPPEERLAAGKPETGAIAISLERAGDSITIRIDDDGRGMDASRIKDAALRKGFITRAQSEAIADRDALMLTTIPGFSTTDRVTELSGRGVGMDVIRTRVETLGGRLRLHSVRGAGATVELRLPLTIVVVKAFLVEAGGRRWAVPLACVRRTLRADEGAAGADGHRPFLTIEGEEVPLFDLAALLGLPARSGTRLPAREALLASDRDRSVAFTVDRILGRREIVVKPLRRPLEELRGFSGATILDDGAIALILDPLSLAPF